MSKRNKFNLGQVVFIDELGFYGLVLASYLDGKERFYKLQTSPNPMDQTNWPENMLRSLRMRERGASR